MPARAFVGRDPIARDRSPPTMLLTAEKIGEDRSELGIWEIRVDGTTRESLRFGKGNILSSSITFEGVGKLSSNDGEGQSREEGTDSSRRMKQVRAIGRNNSPR